MRSYVRKPIKAEQFDGSQKMIHKYHISVYNENGDKYGGFGGPTPNEYTFNETYIDLGDWFVHQADGSIDVISNNVFNKEFTLI